MPFLDSTIVTVLVPFDRNDTVRLAPSTTVRLILVDSVRRTFEASLAVALTLYLPLRTSAPRWSLASFTLSCGPALPAAAV